MSNRNFEEWLGTFRESINGFDYYADFVKARSNAGKLKDELHILNMLVNTKNDIETEFLRILNKYPECLKAIPILLAVRGYELYCQDENITLTYNFKKTAQTPEQYVYFMRETGLFDVIQNDIYHDLRDYIFGIEVGMDSHRRKNRVDENMKVLVENFLKQSSVPYFKEITTSQISDRFGLNIPALPQNKRWDFAVKTPSTLYVIETNFYNSGGSKLNETARSYRLIAEETRGIDGFVFVWITDGKGWLSAKNNLHETFNELDTVFNIADMENGLFNHLFNC